MKAAIELFMSEAPRPKRSPPCIVGVKGSECHWSSGPVGTTSVWPANTSTGAAAAAPQPEVGHAVAGDGLGSEAQGGQPRGDQRLAAAIVRRDGPSGDQLAGEFEGGVHACGRTQQRCTCEARGL